MLLFGVFQHLFQLRNPAFRKRLLELVSGYPVLQCVDQFPFYQIQRTADSRAAVCVTDQHIILGAVLDPGIRSRPALHPLSTFFADDQAGQWIFYAI